MRLEHGTPEWRRGLLIEGLVGTEHMESFMMSARFRAAVEVLADLLPAMVAGLAAEAASQAAIDDILLARMESALTDGFSPSPHRHSS